jgi:prophage tail gpP-like protein
VSDFELRIGGTAYVGWTSIRLTKSLEQLAHSFSISLTDRWAADDTILPFEITAGQTCSVVVDGITLLSGYIDANSLSYDATSKTLTVTGRSKTADLIDCSTVYATGQWRKRPLLNIAKNICDPFGISVSTKVDLGGRMNLSIEEGETAFSTLERAAKMRGVLLLTDSDGDLYFDRVATSRIPTTLEFGINIKRGSYSDSWAGRHSIYTIKSQASGNDNFFGKEAAQIKRSASDSAISRYRPLKLLAENEDSASELEKRVKWERNTRAGRAKRVSYVVQGWTHIGGFWAPNQLVRVVDDLMRFDDELLVATATFTRSNNEGTITTLELAQPEAFDIQPLPSPKRKRGAFW